MPSGEDRKRICVDVRGFTKKREAKAWAVARVLPFIYFCSFCRVWHATRIVPKHCQRVSAQTGRKIDHVPE